MVKEMILTAMPLCDIDLFNFLSVNLNFFITYGLYHNKAHDFNQGWYFSFNVHFMSSFVCLYRMFLFGLRRRDAHRLTALFLGRSQVSPFGHLPVDLQPITAVVSTWPSSAPQKPLKHPIRQRKLYKVNFKNICLFLYELWYNINVSSTETYASKDPRSLNANVRR